MTELIYRVAGMTCQHCANAITEEVSAVAGVSGVTVDLEAKTVLVAGAAVDDDAVRSAIDEAGYEVVG